MSRVKSLTQGLAPGADIEQLLSIGEIPLFAQPSDSPEDTTVILPSSDSIRSTKSNETVSSWWTSSTVSTLTSSLAPSLGKTASTLWSGNNNVASRSKPFRTSPWRQGGLWPRACKKSIDLEAGVSLPLQPLSQGSNYVGCEQTYSPPNPRKESTAIQLTFNFGFKCFTYELEYAVFCQWKYVSLLLSAVHEDGVKCVQIWDEFEGAQVMAGDWEARVIPGWQITIFCQDANVDDDNYSEASDEKDQSWEDGDREDWWFKRWKTRVEKTTERSNKKRSPWMIGVVAAIGTVAAFCTVSWVNFRQHWTTGME